MKFTRESVTAVTVRHVSRGMLRVGEHTVTENVILFRGTIRLGWTPEDPADLRESDLAELIDEAPEMIIFGTGWQPVLPPRDIVFALARRGIGFETMDTPAACRTFNILVGEDRDVAAVLLIE